jgi:hypothetical protein
MAWVDYLDGEKMLSVRAKINALGDSLQAAMINTLTHTEADWNAGVLTDARFINPVQLRSAYGALPKDPSAIQAMGVMRADTAFVIDVAFGCTITQPSGSYFLVTLDRPMADNDYCVIANFRADSSSNMGTISIASMTTGSFRIYCIMDNGNTLSDDIDYCSFMVFGQ